MERGEVFYVDDPLRSFGWDCERGSTWEWSS